MLELTGNDGVTSLTLLITRLKFKIFDYSIPN